MRQQTPTDRPLAPTLAAPATRTSFGALVLRLAVAVLLLAGLTVLASVVLATEF